MEADGLEIVITPGGVAGKSFLAEMVEIELSSDPGGAEYTTLEVTRREHGVEMRRTIYFQADESRWWSDEIRTYNGEVDGDWIEYFGRFFDQPLGSTFEGDFELVYIAGGDSASLMLTALRLKAFTQYEEGAELEDALRAKLSSIGNTLGRLAPYGNLDLSLVGSILYGDLSPRAQQYCSMQALVQALEDSPLGTISSSTEDFDRLRAAIEGLSSVQVEVTDGRGSVVDDLAPGLELLEQPFLLIENRWRLEPELPGCGP